MKILLTAFDPFGERRSIHPRRWKLVQHRLPWRSWEVPFGLYKSSTAAESIRRSI